MRTYTLPAVFLAASLLILCGGCHSATAKGQTHYTYQDEDEAKAAKNGEAFEDPSKVSLSHSVSKADLAKLSKKRAAAQAKMKSNPSDSTLRAYVDATDDLASKTMDCAELTPHEKYPAALKLYRAALAADPRDKTAHAAADTIVEIYKQLGKPVPD